MFRLKEVILFVCILMSWNTWAKNLEFINQCGPYKYTVEIDKAETYDTAIIKHYYQKENAQKKLFHQSEYGMLVKASCTKDKKKADVFVFTETCGGSACLDDMYGLFDLKQKKLLLNPVDWPKGNYKELTKILGNSDFSSFYRDFKDHEFCCINELAKFQNTRLG